MQRITSVGIVGYLRFVCFFIKKRARWKAQLINIVFHFLWSWKVLPFKEKCLKHEFQDRNNVTVPSFFGVQDYSLRPRKILDTDDGVACIICGITDPYESTNLIGVLPCLTIVAFFHSFLRQVAPPVCIYPYIACTDHIKYV